MINEKMRLLGTNRSTIRELFEYGKKMKRELGEDAVFDYSLGNPSVEPPFEVNDTLISLAKDIPSTELHGYTSAEGDITVRRKIAEHIESSFDVKIDPSLIYMTAGAAAALTSVLSAVTTPGESVIVISPFFPEYKVFVEATGAALKTVKAREGDFGLDIGAIKEALDETVAAIIINSPNNPTGAVYSKADIKALADLLEKRSKKYGKPIYIIADEPYRELVYDGIKVPFIPKYYANTIICYSFSKSLSIPGERIGYALVSPTADDKEAVFRAIAGAGRSLGYVCAPSIFQRLAALTLGKTSDLTVYEENRRMLYEALISYGYEVVYPSGAFYLFVKSPIPSAKDFSDIAKKYGLLLVPSDDFGCEGYVRVAYCQSPDMIKRSLGAFAQLIGEFK
ncbi:MAG: pyridoxal phosphate-dependent aminotransferase [Ruminococcaceae bacterium]|nr:pyridoxal phosphate-dependent aminotransferase [Oscillospiraceae bacterium]